MSYKIVECLKKTFIGVGVRTTNQDSKAMVDIGKVWQDFYQDEFLEKIEFQKSSNSYGIYTNYETDFRGEYDFYACIEKEDRADVEGTSSFVAKAGRYAVFTGQGDPMEEVARLWCEIWQSNLLRLYTLDYEEYYLDGTIKIYIAIE